MLCAFTARPILELRQRDKSKIEAVSAYGDRVFVGLNTGSLRLYRLNELPALPSTSLKPPNGGPISSSPAALSSSAPAGAAADQSGGRPSSSSQQRPALKPTELLREVEKFSTRAVEQLAVIKEANILVSLSNYAVSFHDLQTLEPIESPLARTKNASTFAVTSNIVKDASGIPEIVSRMAVAVKRRLLLWSWHESELGEDVAEVVLAESIRSVTWASATKLVCGMNAGFVLVDVETQAVEDIAGQGALGVAASGQGGRFGAVSSAGMGYMGLGGYIPKPLAAKLADGQMLLAKDINTLFVNDEGNALEKRQIPWQSAPEGIGYSYPYIVALQAPAKGSLEVRNPDTLSLLQTISLAGASQLHFPFPTVSLAHAGKGFYISSDRVVWKMDATDYDAQVDELVENEKFDEAVSLLSLLEDALLKNKTQTLREVKMRKAELLFRQKQYRDAMDLFNEDDVDAPPQRVLRLFPRFIAGDLSGDSDSKSDDTESEDAPPGSKPNGDKAAEADVGAEAASPAKGGGSGFTKLLLGHRKANSETASILSTKKGADADVPASSKVKPAEDLPLGGKELKAAVSALNSYLVGARTRLQRVLDPATGKLKARPSESGSAEEAFASLLSHTSKEDTDEGREKELQVVFRIVDTALFRAYMYSVPGLTSSLFRIPNYCDPEVVNETLLEANRYHELVDFFYGKKLHKQALELLKRFGASEKPDEAAPTMHGPQRTVLYLQNLPPELVDLTIEFAEWTLRADPDLGMEVFLADTENAETLPRDRVIKLLAKVDPALEERYLEHIIWELNDMAPEFHNRLVELYLAYLKEKAKGEKWDGVLGRLIRLLKESRQYSLTKAFGLIPRDDPSFFEAQAVVLSNMGQHKQALEIYVFKMKDYAKAEEYCNRIHKTQEPAPSPATSPPPGEGDEAEDAARPSIYHTLLSLYLTPPPPHERNLGPALDLLSKHGSRLPAASTLTLVPDSLPVSELESYFRGRIRNANSIVNQTRIVAGLRKAELVSTQAALLLGDGTADGQTGRNRRVVINEDRVCGVCHKRLGGSVVAVLPDNSVAHYGCLNRAAQGGLKDGGAVRMPSWGRTGRA